MKRCGFVIRVSTDIQARNPEGSLTNQLQRLKAHVEYKNVACREDWMETEKYILKGVSGKNSFKSPEFARLFNDIKLGKINTVLCTALDRISRSVKDFLNFFEILTKYNVEFVCLKQNYDTTSSQGKLFITIMMALAEFEREQTSERNKDATLARADRGLWNGGQILGYDLDPTKKGHLIVNEKEKAIVNFAFDTYLKCGGIIETARRLSEQCYRTKEYTSRRDKFHPAREFFKSSVQFMLTNYAYIGKKEINKHNKPKDQTKLPERDRYRLAAASWESIIDMEKFQKVQHLLNKNHTTKHNQTTPIKHIYILNHGLLWCEKCGKQMQGSCCTGRQGTKYYYYQCNHCKFKIPAGEIETIVIERIKFLSNEKGYLGDIIEKANRKMQKELPQMKKQKDLLQKELEEAKNSADKLMNKWLSSPGDNSSAFIKDKLEQLGKRRKEIEAGILKLELMIDEIKREVVDQDLVIQALKKFAKVFDDAPPYRQKELIQSVMQKALISRDSIKIALYGRQPDIGQIEPGKAQENLRSGLPDWLPGLDSNQEPRLQRAV